jgi:hypothetical protein
MNSGRSRIARSRRQSADRKTSDCGPSGEFRRAFWNYDFLGALPGVEAYLGERKIKFQGVNPKPMMLRVNGKLGTFCGHPMLEHFRFTKAHRGFCLK